MRLVLSVMPLVHQTDKDEFRERHLWKHHVKPTYQGILNSLKEASSFEGGITAVTNTCQSRVAGRWYERVIRWWGCGARRFASTAPVTHPRRTAFQGRSSGVPGAFHGRSARPSAGLPAERPPPCGSAAHATVKLCRSSDTHLTELHSLVLPDSAI